jgi:CHAT domain-containing protein/tetratricopeptide (TPR) repeat protein
MPKPLATAILSVLLSAPLAQAAPDVSKRLEEADRLAWLTDWYTALPIYADVERVATGSRNRRDAMYAKFGRLRGQMQTLPLSDLSEQIAVDLESPLAKADAKLRLRGLTVKGDIDLEWDVQAAQRDWQEARQIARELGHKGWENRANGELGIIAFLKGNTGEATTLVQQALQVATKSGDVGGQLRYMGTIANGLVLAGYAPLAMGYVDRALKFANEHPEAGFPFVVYSTKVLTLLAQNQPDEAEQFAKAAMSEARAGDRRIKETELLMLLARIAEKRGQPDQAIQYLDRAITTARAGRVQRLLGDAEALLADAFRARGDLREARRHATTAVAETQATGSRFTLATRFRVLAEILAAQGSVAEANRVYEQATDVVEGIMVNVPSREAQARLIGVRSNLYEGHFRLVAERLADPIKAYDVIERARGRAAADVLRALPDENPRAPQAVGDEVRTISRLQVRLMRARSPSERKGLLDQLWEAEQRTKLSAAGPRINLPIGTDRVPLKTLQRQLAGTEVILEYVLTEPHSYCLLIGRGQVRLVQLPSRKQIEQLVERFTADVRGVKGDTSDTAKELYDLLLRPLAGWQTAHRLFIVPDGKLHLLPFDALLSLNAIQPRVVSTVPSGNVLFLLRTRAQRGKTERPLLAVGGVPYDRMFAGKPPAIVPARSHDTRGLFDAAYPSNLPVLASAQAEVLTAARLLGPRSVVLTGDEATESGVKAQNLQDFGILHFAVHAFADPKVPERAAVVLLNDPGAGEDGLLQPREIGQFRLAAGVVVLSACDTAIGPTLGQEGILNIARAFLLAGAQSVITTLWAVSDATSTALMRRFYENMAAGHDVAEALMRSKSTVMEQFGSRALPTVAAFQIVGVGDHRLVTQGAPVSATGGGSAR